MYVFIIISVSVLILGFYIYDQRKARAAYLHSQETIKCNPLQKYPARFSKIAQSTPKVAVKPLPDYRKHAHSNLPVIETPLHKTKTLIIDCNQEMPKSIIEPRAKEWSLEFTPNLSSKYNN